jgi:esterase
MVDHSSTPPNTALELTPLLAPNFRIVAIEARGHSLSDKVDDGYDLATIAGDLGGAIVALGISRRHCQLNP